MKLIDSWLVTAFAVLGIACSNRPDSDAAISAALARLDPDQVISDMTTLAGPELGARRSGDESYLTAVRWLEEELKTAGLKPAGDQGSFRQNITLRHSITESAELQLHVNGETWELQPRVDYRMTPDLHQAESFASGKLVVVGYGIDAPGYNDYQGIDCQGKVVVILRGAVPKAIDKDVAAIYSRPNVLWESAARHGAVGVIVVCKNDHEMTALEHRTEGQMIWLQSGDKLPASADTYNDHPPGLLRAYLSTTAAKKLFSSCGRDLDAALKSVAAGNSQTPYELGASAGMMISNRMENKVGVNVVAVLPGSDPELKDEYVMLGGHFDTHGNFHDQLYPGYYDNGSGSAMILEIARTLASLPKEMRPRRSVLFAWFCAEEMGLMGSNAYAHNPTVPIGNLVAMINIDMVLATFKTKQVIGFGAEYSTLGQTLAQACQRLGLELVPDPMPGMVLFIRSDQASFCLAGVPSLFPWSGFTAGSDGEKAFGAFMGGIYHSPKDAVGQVTEPETVRDFTAVNLVTALMVANADQRPAWNDSYLGKFFAAKAKR